MQPWASSASGRTWQQELHFGWKRGRKYFFRFQYIWRASAFHLWLASRSPKFPWLCYIQYNFRKRPLPWPITIACKGAPFYSYEFILSSVAVYLFPIYFSHLLAESSILADSFTVNMSKPVWGARGTAGFLTLAPVLSNISSVFGVRFFGVSI